MTAEHLVTVYGTTVMLCAPDGSPIADASSATDVIGEALGERAELVAIPAERLAPEFFDLRTGVAGDIAQKFVNYHVRLAIVGDIAGHLDTSKSLSSWVAESNRGTDLWFCPTFDNLRERLDRRHKSR